MSFTLDALLNEASDGLQTTVALSSTSVTVLYYALAFLERRQFWLDYENDPADEITDSDWDTINEIVALANRELMTPEVGAVFMYMTSSPPPNCLECAGGTYLRVDFPLLYALLDPVYVIDADHFTLPDLRGRVPLGVGTGSGLSTYSAGDTGGEEYHTLTVTETPSHSHTDVGHTHVEGATIPTAITIGAGVPAPAAIGSVSVTGSGSANLTSTGGDGAHENRQPFLAIRFCVRAS